MFSFFRRKKDNPLTVLDDAVDVNELKMSLQSRISWRQEMMKKSVEDTFSELNIIGGMYRYRVMSVDDRSHYFAIMVETTKHFAISEYISTTKLSSIESLLKSRSFDNYGIVVDGVYWRANETVEVFEQAARRPLGFPSNRPIKTIEELTAQFSDFTDTLPLVYETAHVEEFDPVTDEEAEAFRRAIAAGQKPGPLQVGDQEYSTDIMPLGPN